MARHVQSTVGNGDSTVKPQARLRNSGTNLEAQEGQYLKRGEVNEQIVKLHMKLEDCENNHADLRQLVEMVQKAKDSPAVEEGMKTEKYVGNAAFVRAVSGSQQNECFPDGCVAS